MRGEMRNRNINWFGLSHSFERIPSSKTNSFE